MSKNLKVLLILVAIATAIYFLVVRQPWSTLRNELKDFAIQDTASVTKFFLADKRGHSVTVAKNDKGVWMVDNTFKADVDKVNLLLATMHDVTVRNPISEKEFNNVVATLSTEGIKAEFYSGEDNIKTIYVGPGSADQSGTFMLIEGSSAPFVTHIDGFVGYLTPRFYTYPIKWKSREVYNIPEADITSVTVTYPQKNAESFKVTNDAQKTVTALSTNQVVPCDPKFVRFYLASFTNLFFEGYDEDMFGAKADSIYKLTPYCIIDLEKKDGTKIKVQLNHKSVSDHTKQLYNTDGHLLAYDTEKYYGFINDDKNIVQIQQYSFGKILKTLNDFTAQAPLP